MMSTTLLFGLVLFAGFIGGELANCDEQQANISHTTLKTWAVYDYLFDSSLILLKYMANER